MRPVNSKADFVERYAAGEFGNMSPTWNSLSDFLLSDSNRGLYHIRNRVAGGSTWYNLSPRELQDKWQELCSSGVDPKTLYVSEMCPTQFTILQGEVQRSLSYVDLTYSRVVAPMREALAVETKFASGICAVTLLKWAMDASSFNWLEELFLRYPGHTVEFTCLSVCWGTLPNLNTLFWEVRNY